MNTRKPAPTDARDVASVQSALDATAMRLHGIVSRTDSARIAAEVLRLNDAVREAVAPYGPSAEPPGSFMRALLAMADASNGAPR